MKVKDVILDLIFPKYCLGCGKEGQYICKNCELYLMDVPPMAELTSLWEYNGIIKEAIRRIKFNSEWDIVKELINKKDFDIPAVDAITYVPMTKKKERERGFNQAEVIAKELGKKLNKPVVKMLDKIKETSDQIGLSREDRLKNLKDCFQTRRGPDSRRLRSSFLETGPLEILLVDDVYTTGATMEGCRRTLGRAGFKNIWGFTIAKTI